MPQRDVEMDVADPAQLGRRDEDEDEEAEQDANNSAEEAPEDAAANVEEEDEQLAFGESGDEEGEEEGELDEEGELGELQLAFDEYGGGGDGCSGDGCSGGDEAADLSTQVSSAISCCSNGISGSSSSNSIAV